MASIVIYPQPITSGVSINAGGEESGKPIENLTDMNINTTWQNDDNNETVTIDWDFGSNIDPNYLIIANHNLTDTDYGIKFIQGSGGVGGSFVVEEYLLGDAGTYHDYTSSDTPIWLETFDEPQQVERYYRLEIENNNGVKPEIGMVVFGDYITLNANYNLGGSRGDGYKTEIRERDGGQIYANQLANERKRFVLSWDDIAETDHDYWETIFSLIQGRLYPFFFTDIDSVKYLVRSEQDELQQTDNEYQLYSFSLNLLEEKLNNDVS